MCLWTASLGVLCLLLVSSLSWAAPAPGDNGAVVPRFGVHEIVLKTDEVFDNPFWDPSVSARFTSPSGKVIDVDGFYYGGDEWRIRFVPRELGQWQYQAVLQGKAKTVKADGQFRCEGQSGEGFLRISPRNCYRMEYDSGRAFTGVGIQTCGAIKDVDFDGPAADGNWKTIPMEQWTQEFKGAVSLVRLNLSCNIKAGCAVPLIPDADRPDRYNLETCQALDRMYTAHRAAGFSEIAIFFQDMSLYGKYAGVFGMGRDTRDWKNVHAANMPMQEKYLRYVVNRFGCWIDIWELFNEDSYAPDDYLAHLFKVVRAADPYDHIITSNFSRPEKPFCEIIAPHEYMNIPAEEVDTDLCKQIAAMKSFGKPIQYTEFGNKGTLPNVDPIKWRVSAWTAYMNETGMLYWGMSGRKVPGGAGRGNSNAYIGPDTRQHFRVLLDFTHDLPVDMRPRFSYDSPEFQFRGYAMSNEAITVLYLHRRGGYQGQTKPQLLNVHTGPGRFSVRWVNPDDGKQFGDLQQLSTSHQYLGVEVPSFSIDLACRIDRVDTPMPPAPPPTAGPAGQAQPVPAGWKVAWTADLHDPKAVDNWLTTAGALDIRDGTLSLRSEPLNEGETTLASPTFPGSVRVEYVGYLTGKDQGDLTTLLNVSSQGVDSGYALQFAGSGRTLTRALRAGKPLEPELKDVKFEVGRAYRIAAERDGNTIRFFVDGVKLIEATDSQPLTVRGLDRIGFYTFNGALCVKDLRVLVKEQ